MVDLPALRAALRALPGAADPHVVKEEPSTYLNGGVRLTLASGTWVEVATVDSDPVPLLGFADPDRSPFRARLAGEPWDHYHRDGAVSADEIRGMAPVTLLEVAVSRPGGGARLVVIQDDAVRWEQEEAGILTQDFEDHLERAACWAAMGLRRPRDGWTLRTGED